MKFKRKIKWQQCCHCLSRKCMDCCSTKKAKKTFEKLCAWLLRHFSPQLMLIKNFSFINASKKERKCQGIWRFPVKTDGFLTLERIRKYNLGCLCTLYKWWRHSERASTRQSKFPNSTRYCHHYKKLQQRMQQNSDYVNKMNWWRRSSTKRAEAMKFKKQFFVNTAAAQTLTLINVDWKCALRHHCKINQTENECE